MLAVVIKEFQQLHRDRRTVAMLVMIPLVLLIVFGYAASFDVNTLQAAVYGPNAQQVAAQLPSQVEVIVTDPAMMWIRSGSLFHSLWVRVT